jgi:hypothetical protein
MENVEVDPGRVIAGLKNRLADALVDLTMAEAAVEQYQRTIRNLEERVQEQEQGKG